MSIFSTILEKLGLKQTAAQVAASTKQTAAQRAFSTLTDKVGASAAIPMVDVVGKLNNLAAKSNQQLDWKVSIVDLMKLLGLDSSFENRKKLAVELGCPADLMKDSASMNTWLHKTVLAKLAEHGGNI
ncbi:MAG: DUF3597 domain-containing protein, partial [Anaerolineaceae bacterium]